MLDKSRLPFVSPRHVYRSRFAEALFNFHARSLQLDWFASSRSPRIHAVNAGLALETSLGLLERMIPLDTTFASPASLTEYNLSNASATIALRQSEHLPTMLIDFPRWAGRIPLWNVHDIEEVPATDALPLFE
jgi:protein-tyrosine phosphatase